MGIVISNSVILHKKCLFSLTKPFRNMLEKQGKINWLENLSVSRTRDILDLLSLGKKIQDVLKSVSL